jgi:hypothetical protein
MVPGYKEFLRWVEGGVLFVNDYSNLYWVGPDSETERLLVPDIATDGIYTFLDIR